jgi:hypothetical protein
MEIHECTRCHKPRPCGEPHQTEIWVCAACILDELLWDGHDPEVAWKLTYEEVWGDGVDWAKYPPPIMFEDEAAARRNAQLSLLPSLHADE